MTITIATLRAAGLTAEQIVRVVETAENEKATRRREQNRIAKRNQRSRQQCQQITADTLPLPYPPPMVSPITPSLTPSLTLPLPVYSAKSQQNWPRDYREQFWNAYPRKVGKKATFRKLELVAKLGEIEFPQLLQAVRMIDDSDEKFIPHPTTWLNQGRYLDGVGLRGANGQHAWQAREKARDERIANQLAEREAFAAHDRRKANGGHRA